jgi:hypothetical protein
MGRPIARDDAFLSPAYTSCIAVSAAVCAASFVTSSTKRRRISPRRSRSLPSGPCSSSASRPLAQPPRRRRSDCAPIRTSVLRRRSLSRRSSRRWRRGGRSWVRLVRRRNRRIGGSKRNSPQMRRASQRRRCSCILPVRDVGRFAPLRSQHPRTIVQAMVAAVAGAQAAVKQQVSHLNPRMQARVAVTGEASDAARPQPGDARPKRKQSEV